MSSTDDRLTPLVRAARLYRRATNPVSHLARRFIARLAQEPRPAAGLCLDVGAGHGPYRADLERALPGLTYVALDRHLGCDDGVAADATALPFADGSVAMVVSFDVLQHVAEAEVALAEVCRVLAPGGLALLTYPFLYSECDVHDFRRWTIEGMEQDLRRRGLDVAWTEPRGGALFALSCGLTWAIEHAVPGQRKSWRAERTAGSVARAAVTAGLSVPGVAAQWAALGLDALLPRSGAYMGAATLARKPAGAGQRR